MKFTNAMIVRLCWQDYKNLFRKLINPGIIYRQEGFSTKTMLNWGNVLSNHLHFEGDITEQCSHCSHAEMTNSEG